MGLRFLLAVDTFPDNPWERDRLPAIRKALRDRSHDIMDVYEFNSCEEAHSIHSAKGGTYFADKDPVELNNKFYEKVASYKCDILILGTVDNYSQFLFYETIKKLQDNGVFVVGILGDDEFTSDRNRLYVPMFDRVVAYVSRCVAEYNAIVPDSCYYLPNSCHFVCEDFSSLHVEDEDKLHDVSFFGAPFGARPAMVEALIENGVNVSLFGSQKWQQYGKLKKHYHGYADTKDFDRLVRSSKIVLAFLEDHLDGSLHMNTKIWEAVRNGQMCIASHYQPLIADYGLIENEDIVMYDSTTDLVQKVKYYLNRPDDRKRIAANIFAKIKENFSYEKLYTSLFTNIEMAHAQKKSSLEAGELADNMQIVTILDYSFSGEFPHGFNVVKVPHEKKWRQNLRTNYFEMVKTPFVVFSYGGYYSQYLQKMLKLFPDILTDGKSELLPMTCHAQLPSIGSIVWTRDAFYREFLDANFRQTKNPVDNCFHNLRLCDLNKAENNWLIHPVECLKRFSQAVLQKMQTVRM
jgi:spore maturation protein CgeB